MEAAAATAGHNKSVVVADRMDPPPAYEEIANLHVAVPVHSSLTVASAAAKAKAKAKEAEASGQQQPDV